jgi:hypothetical protein
MMPAPGPKLCCAVPADLRVAHDLFLGLLVQAQTLETRL